MKIEIEVYCNNCHRKMGNPFNDTNYRCPDCGSSVMLHVKGD